MKRLSNVPRWAWVLTGITVVAGLMTPFIMAFPNVNELNAGMPKDTTRVLASGSEILASIHKDTFRTQVLLSNISPHLRKAVVAAEDARFYEHPGIDIRGIGRAFWTNITSASFREGASTITQQLARTLYLSRRKNFMRKFAEAILALQLEKNYTKDGILELYLNNVYWGHNSYGAEASAQLYFGKHARDLTLAESAMMAGMLRAPDSFSPIKYPHVARNRRALILKRMVELKMISQADADQADKEPLKVTMRRVNQYKYAAPYFTSTVINELRKVIGEEAIDNGGYSIETTLDLKMQMAAEQVVEGFLKAEGATYHFSQAALVAIDPRTGDVKALVGGKDFAQSEFNRAVQSRRQPGSSFKPFIYTAAMEMGISPGDIWQDRSTAFDVPPSNDTPNGKWAPKNFDRRFNGGVTTRYAIEKSLNIPAIKVLQTVGISRAEDVARRMGIQSPLVPGLSMALGTSELSLLEMTSAYGAFANGGVAIPPHFISRITDPMGNTVMKAEPKPRQAIDHRVAAAMVDMMKGVLIRGTGVRGRIARPAAAKTGTTEHFHDAWFIGYVPQLVVGVWVGNDDNSSMRGVAEVAVCPRMWKAFMDLALANEPVMDFEAPSDMEMGTVCADSGKAPNSYCPAGRLRRDLFWVGHVPTELCTVHREAAPPEEVPADETETEEAPPEEDRNGLF